MRGDKLRYYRELLDHGVDCAFSFTFIADPGACDRAAELADSVLDLPYYERLTDSEIAAVVSAVKTIDGNGEPS